MNKVFCLILATYLLLAGNFLSYASVSNDQIEIFSLFKALYQDYEDAFDNYDSDFIEMDKYFVKSEQTDKDKLIIKTVLKRKILMSQMHSLGLEEINKVINYKYEIESLDNNIGKMRVFVIKDFNYTFSPNIDSSVGDLYTVTFVRINNKWLISNIDGFVDTNFKEYLNSINVDLKDRSSLNEYNDRLDNDVKYLYNELLKRDIENIVTESQPVSNRAVSYNGVGAANYALQYALNFNSNYYDFTSSGGDCTNFVSQAIHEGGNLPEHFGTQYDTNSWFYISGSNRSATWTGANQFGEYVFSTESKINAQLSSFYNIGIGDVIQSLSGTNAYHSYMVTGIQNSGSSRADLFISAHSTNRKNVSFMYYYYNPPYNRFIDILGSK
ncbi:MAG: hypothetical protein BGO41_08350 [Clostridiales bacterium 38-18]|nr:MAG: hypothetical protein BGO41_08350 [Clostridiales bacterium 38-18]